MEIRGSTRLIAVFGDPVSHSLSPSMHNPAFAAHGLDYAYVPLRVAPENLKAAVEAMRLFSFRGANVTVPHKQAVIPFLDEVSELSRVMGAVNTIVNDGGRLKGTTTDPDGFLEGFRAAGHGFTGKAVAVLGNGGSARTVVYTLLMRERPARVLIAARDAGRSRALADEVFAKLGRRPDVVALSEYPSMRQGIDVVVNTTTLGMVPHAEASPLGPDALEPGQIVYDIVYAPERTLLLRHAEARGLDTVGGLGMLAHQGVASFKIWTGVDPDPELFYRCLRERLRSAP